MLFNFCPKRDASFWENGSKLKRFVLELQTGGFADYKSTITFLAVVFTPSVIVVVHIRIFKIF